MSPLWKADCTGLFKVDCINPGHVYTCIRTLSLPLYLLLFIKGRLYVSQSHFECLQLISMRAKSMQRLAHMEKRTQQHSLSCHLNNSHLSSGSDPNSVLAPTQTLVVCRWTLSALLRACFAWFSYDLKVCTNDPFCGIQLVVSKWHI